MESLLIDLARHGRVLQASDEFLNPAATLLDPAPPVADPARRGPHGPWLDGWETRRVRPPGHEWAIVQLGRPGTVHRVVVDTSHVTLSLPAACSVEAIDLPGDPGMVDLLRHRSRWREIVPRTDLRGAGPHRFEVTAGTATHVRLVIYPDGGVARLRVLGEPAAPGDLTDRGTSDLASLDLGGLVVAASDPATTSPNRMLERGGPADHHDGWVTRRRRTPGNEWAVVRLGGRSLLERIEVDTRKFPGDSPEEAAVMAIDTAADPLPDDPRWRPLVERFEVRPDAVNKAAVSEDAPPATHLRLDLHPDGAVARLRAVGTAAPDDEGGQGEQRADDPHDEAAAG